MRVFIAYDLPENVRKKLYDAAPKFNGIKYVDYRNMHLTIKFLGEVSDSTVNEYKKRLDSLVLKKIKASFGKVGFFPSDDFIRVIWIGIKADFDENLLKKLDVKDWIPHVTIGRVKRRLKEKEKESFKNLKLEDNFTIESLGIYRSELTPEGPIYHLIKRYDLCD